MQIKMYIVVTLEPSLHTRQTLHTNAQTLKAQAYHRTA